MDCKVQQIKKKVFRFKHCSNNFNNFMITEETLVLNLYLKVKTKINLSSSHFSIMNSKNFFKK